MINAPSHQRPGIRPAIVRRRGECARGERVCGAAAQRRDFIGSEQTRQGSAGVPIAISKVSLQPSQVRSQVGREGLAREVPNHRPQLVVDVEAQPMVDGDDARVPSAQAMSALAVGVVGDQVEERERS